MDLTFYIIYTPNSFTKLKLAISSLILHTNYNYILVGNGINEKEFNEIDNFTKNTRQVSLLDLPGNITIPHGTALTHLFNTSDSQYFCFMDSDVFALYDFSIVLEDLITNHDVVSSCKPIEWLHKESAKGYRGHCTTSPSGKNVAMTYFSVYKRAEISPLLEKYKISFERYMRKQQVPHLVQSLLSKKDQHTWKFNTAKLLNIIQSYHDQKFAYHEFKGLIHLGGVSRYSEHSNNGTRKKITHSNSQALDRIESRRFFFELLTNLESSIINIPNLKLKDKTFQRNIERATEKLVALDGKIKRHRNNL